ncbi:MAG: DUF6522 family protein, partial [Candidatus Binataceae bacterium]
CMAAAMDLTELAHGTVSLDAAVIARGLGLEPDQVLEQLRTGRLAARCEQGIGEDAGRFRLTFLQENRRLWLILDQAGRILERSIVGQRIRRAVRRRPGSDP